MHKQLARMRVDEASAKLRALEHSGVPEKDWVMIMKLQALS